MFSRRTVRFAGYAFIVLLALALAGISALLYLAAQVPFL